MSMVLLEGQVINTDQIKELIVRPRKDDRYNDVFAPVIVLSNGREIVYGENFQNEELARASLPILLDRMNNGSDCQSQAFKLSQVRERDERKIYTLK